MITLQKPLGKIELTADYFCSLASIAALSCEGVTGLTEVGTAQGIRSIFENKDTQSKNVKIKTEDSKLIVDLHIEVLFGMNIAEIVKDVITKVRFSIEKATDLEVAKVNVFVDAVRQEKANQGSAESD
jgi:Uncharacterized protein conserved in bacteria